MDSIDSQIIDLLREDGRISYAELARQVGLTAPSVQDRVTKLEKANIITGFRAVVDHSAIGTPVTALIGLVTNSARNYSDITEQLSQIEEIEDCYFLAGEECYMLKVRVAEIEDLERLIEQLGRIDGVSRTRTTITLSTKWEGRPKLLTPEE
ncbi:Lrp/AsnC family transcriptional regulator [Haloglycomyces albus]|uniref:Lrp/AsnC family transcriptional regulator n=1 Tax=Haloglycomyces albus TaxID=526067 RepID=UPI00046D72E5|nr:Lrp/AsnC family transcriptional regulator [Haloglycomyces albus]